MIPDQRLLRLPDRLFNRLKLLRHIDAVPARLDHLDDPLEMAVGPLQSPDDLGMRFVDVYLLVHAFDTIPQEGI